MVDLVDSHGRPRVVVTGMGVKTPAGVDIDSFWDARPRRSAAPPRRSSGSTRPSSPCGSRAKSSNTTRRRTSARRRCAASTASRSSASVPPPTRSSDAGELGADPSRVAVIAATGVGGLETMEENESTFLARARAG